MMENKYFSARRQQNTAERLNHADDKAKEYARDGNRFHNFEKTAEQLNLIPEQVVLCHSEKHWQSICAFVRGLAAGASVVDIESSFTEPIDGRIGDLQNYLDIIQIMIQQRRAEELVDLPDPPKK